jgi:hypothetical protein
MKEVENNTPATSSADTDQHEDRRQYLEREESTTSYPIIGDGYSDTISVVSDITTPTVMPGQVVPVEEHYDAPPPMQIDFNRKTSKSKARSFASSGTYEPPSESLMKEMTMAQPLAVATSTEPTTASWQTPVPKLSGAAAKRRQSHQQAMAQLESSGQRSLLGKSNQYAVSISASVQKMSIAANNNNETATKVKTTSRRSSGGTTASAAAAAACDLSNAIVVPSGNGNNSTPIIKKPTFTMNNSNDMDALMFTDFTSTDTKNAFNATTNLFHDNAFLQSGFSSTVTKPNTKKVDNFFDFGSLDSTTSSTKQSFGDAGSFDSDGFPMGNNSDDDPFAISTFTNDFPNDAFQSGGAFGTTDGTKSNRDAGKKKKTPTTTSGGRRSSLKSAPGNGEKVKKMTDAKHDTDDKLRKKKTSA